MHPVVVMATLTVCTAFMLHAQGSSRNDSLENGQGEQSIAPTRAVMKGSAPVPKTVGWFAGNINDGGRFLLSNVASLDNSTVRIADRMLRCCNDLSVTENGSVPMTDAPPYLSRANDSYAQYTAAGIEVLVNLGGKADVVAPMYARKEKFAEEMLALALRWNFTGYTMDWEFG
eukprot:SAG31_NODE_8152_length_1508_cov_7.717486_2_plen_172_part_01